jgi:hypothetical protein
VTRSIVEDGIAFVSGTARSNRPSRHRGYVAFLTLTDRTAAAEYVQQMTAAFAAFNDASSPAGTDEVAETLTEPSQRKDETNDATLTGSKFLYHSL